MATARDILNADIRRIAGMNGIDPLPEAGSIEGLLSDHLIESGRAAADAVNVMLEEATGVPALDPSRVSFSDAFISLATALIPRDLLVALGVFPVRLNKHRLHLVMAVPGDSEAIHRIEAWTGSLVVPYVCHSRGIISAIERILPAADAVGEIPDDLDALTLAAAGTVSAKVSDQVETLRVLTDVPLIRLVQGLLAAAVERGASDIHIEPGREGCRIRIRKDGVLNRFHTTPAVLREPIMNRLKLMADMDVTDRRTPQDGSISFGVIPGREIDLRVSSLPTVNGEKVVLRILDRADVGFDLEALGMEVPDLKRLNRSISQPSGLVLVTGPTGSGKTTTLYAILNHLNQTSVNIVTAEDPVEYRLEGVTQVNCSEESGVSFADALRSFLRQDPDIIMVGEIRDLETAEFAVKAAMTGHLVFSTLHTMDAVGAVQRLVNMGVPPYLIVSAKVTVVAQRLLRRICENCRVVDEGRAEALSVLSIDNPASLSLFRGSGCDDCNGTGYSGRLGVYELFAVSEAVSELILKDASSEALRKVAKSEGMITLREAALLKLKDGRTTLDEVLRVTMDM
ncbi:MAG: type II secretion system protein GspE [Deltaproteobacteria bacterium]|nr:MAG: type II secretion system protein GspE [Deltaproteobacteria bacterium]